MGKGDLIRKINFPKYVIVLAGSFSALINLAFNFVVIGIFMYFDHVSLHLSDLILLPLIAELFIFSLSLAFFLSATFVRFRDLSYIWEVVVQGGFYATPVLYPMSRLPTRFAKILILNPLAQIFQDARYVLVTPASTTISKLYGGDKWIWLIPFGIVIIVTAVAMT